MPPTAPPLAALQAAIKAAAGLGGESTTVLFLFLREVKKALFEAQVAERRGRSRRSAGDPTSEARQCRSLSHAIAAVIHGRSRWVTAIS